MSDFVDLPPTQRAPLDTLLASLGNSQIIQAVMLENSDSADLAKRYLLAHVPPPFQAASLNAPWTNKTTFLDELATASKVSTAPARDAEIADPNSLDPVSAKVNTPVAQALPTMLVITQANLLTAGNIHTLAEIRAASANTAQPFAIILMGSQGLENLLPHFENSVAVNTPVHLVHFPGLTELDTIDHIQRHMKASGWTGELPFDLSVLKRIHAESNGVPSAINRLCEKALEEIQLRTRSQVAETLVGASPRSEVPLASSLVPSPIQLDRVATPTIPATPTQHQAFEGLDFEFPPLHTATSNAEPFSAKGPPPDFSSVSKSKNGFSPRNTALACGAAGALVAIVFAVTSGGQKASPTPETMASQAAAQNANMPMNAPEVAKTETQSTATPMLQTSEVKTRSSEQVPQPDTQSAPTPPSAPMAGPAPQFSQLAKGTGAAWAAMAKRWGLRLEGPDVCVEALKQTHQCFRKLNADLALVQSLDRPGLVQIQQDRISRWVLLTNLSSENATLESGSIRWQFPVSEFTAAWTGEYLTLWRQPMPRSSPLYSSAPEDPSGRWLDAELQKLQAKGELPPTATDATARIKAFQEKNGLPGNGKAVSSTFMRLNQLIGVPEPTLAR